MKRIMSLLLAVLFAFGVWMGTASASDAREQSADLTLNEAVAMALSHSKAVKKAGLDIDRADEEREEAEKLVDFIPTGVGLYAPGVREAYTNMLTKELQWQMSKRSLTAAEDKVALDACVKYWAVQSAQKAVTAQEAALEKARADLRKVEAGYALGMVNRETLLGAQALFEQAKGALEAARLELTNAYESLNQAIGLYRYDRPVLVDELIYTPLEISDLDSAVQRTIAQNPQVWQAEQLVVIRDRVRYIQDNWDIADIDLQKSELDAADLKESMKLLARNLYYVTRKLEESYPAALNGVESAQEALRVAELKYEVGLVTKGDVAAAKAQLEQARTRLHELTAQHAQFKLAFEKPWAYIGGTSAGAPNAH